MRIIVCIKQVPYIDQLKFDAQAGRLIREGVDSEINPFDKRALTKAIELKKELGAETVVVTMGPPQAAAALREALAMGIDRAVHLLGREFAGADTLATARALALACKRIGYDLIFCGRYSTDAETAQVPGMLAELLDLPQVTGVTRLELKEDGRFTATREMDDGFQTLAGELPVLLSAAERLTKPIKLAPKDLIAAQNLPIEVITPRELSPDVSIFGIAGSPTWVEAIFSVEPQRKHIVRRVDGNAEAIVAQLVEDLVGEGLFGEWKTREHGPLRPLPSAGRHGPSFWTVAEIIEGEIRPATLELLGKSIELAHQVDGEIDAVVIGADVQRHAEVLAAHGADKVYVAESPDLADYMTEPYTQVLADAIKQYEPFAVFLPSTANGRDLAPRVAARLGIGLTGDCIDLRMDEQGRLVQLKPAFGGNIIAPILTRTTPVMATVRPGMLRKAEAEPDRRAEIIRLPVENLHARLRLVGSDVNTEEGVHLDEADVVIGVGMGIGGPENISLVQDLAQALDASIAATRRVVDAGWLPRQVQVGLTGHSISPALYIALGVRGAFNHTVGIQRAGLVLAINNNPDADIFKQCDYGLVGDWYEIATALLKALLEKKKQIQLA